MKSRDMVQALYGIAKKGVIANYQERELLKKAAARITDLETERRTLLSKLADAEQIGLAMEDDGK